MPVTEAGSASATLDRPSTVGNVAKSTTLGRTYNQAHVSRKYEKGKRRFSVYWTWSYPWEANRDVSALDNRFSTMTEVRQLDGLSMSRWSTRKRCFSRGLPELLSCFICHL